ncbi:MAG: hypothetical protein AAFX78_01695 [Cyanobacteria bacterium J06638_20]
MVAVKCINFLATVAIVNWPRGLSTPGWVQNLQYTVRPIHYLDAIATAVSLVSAPRSSITS